MFIGTRTVNIPFRYMIMQKQAYYNFMDGPFQFEDAEVQRIMIENWGSDGKITMRQIKAVTSLNDKFHNSNIVKFNEFRYFTGIINLEDSAFQSSKITDIILPSSIRTMGTMSLCDCGSLVNVTIPEGVTSVGWGCFAHTNSLKNITFPESVTNIEAACFVDSGITEFTIPSKVREIKERTFEQCYSCRKMIFKGPLDSIAEGSLPYYLRTLEGYGVENNTMLVVDNRIKVIAGTVQEENLVIKDGITAIDCALGWQPNITSIYLPDSVVSLSENCFSGCGNVTSIRLSPNITVLPDYALPSNLSELVLPPKLEVLGAENIYSYNGKTLELPETLREIGEYCFAYSDIEEFVLPDSIETLGNSCFAYCTSLKKLILPKDITSIPEWMCQGCTSLKEITLPDSVQGTGKGCFSGCYNLENIYSLRATSDHKSLIDSNATYTFLVAVASKGMTEYTVPSNVTYVAPQALTMCKTLVKLIIPDGVTNIGDSAFIDNTNLKTISVPDTIQSGSYRGIFSGCNISRVEGSAASEDNRSFSIGNKLGFVAEYGLIDYTVPNGVESIEGDVFEDSNLMTVTLPESCTGLGYHSFYSSLIQSIICKGNITWIGSGSFNCCSNLQTIYLNSPTAPGLGQEGVFKPYWSSNSYSCAGGDTKDEGTNSFYIPTGATGYTSGEWTNVLTNTNYCGFTIKYF